MRPVRDGGASPIRQIRMADARPGRPVTIAMAGAWPAHAPGEESPHLSPPGDAMRRKALPIVGFAVLDMSSRRTLDASRPARDAS